MDKLMSDVVEWDIPNWSRAIKAWKIGGGNNQSLAGKNVLDIGGRNGGLSLYFALAGANVICSDLDFVKNNSVNQAKSLHMKKIASLGQILEIYFSWRT